MATDTKKANKAKPDEAVSPEESVLSQEDAVVSPVETQESLEEAQESLEDAPEEPKKYPEKGTAYKLQLNIPQVVEIPRDHVAVVEHMHYGAARAGDERVFPGKSVEVEGDHVVLTSSSCSIVQVWFKKEGK